MPAWRLHDLRKIFSTGTHELGIAHETVKEMMGHRIEEQEGAPGIYDHARLRNLEHKRDALRDWADYVEQLVGGHVVRFPERRVVALIRLTATESPRYQCYSRTH
ncbi:MAG: hypothetical protein ABSG76_22400 [Xanthobacteraceae bacterium]